MRTIVITGSTRGIGFGLSHALLERGAQVAINGRTQDSVQRALDRLGASFSEHRFTGYAADVRKPDQLQALWDTVARRFGGVDIWVNNAGVAGHPKMVWEQTAEAAEEILASNIAGAIFGSQVAVRGMLEQGGGAVYIMEGMGSDGRTHEGLTLYGTSKYALHYLMMALAEELRDTSVIAASLRPGMVATSMLTEPYRGRPEAWDRAAPIFNILADPVDTAAAWLAEAVLSNRRSGVVLSRLSRLDIILRFLLAPIRKRDLFPDFDPSE